MKRLKDIVFAISKHHFLLICFIIIQSICFAQNYHLPLWEREIPNYQEVIDEEKEADQKPFIEVYLPSKGIATGQAVVICPGGGYKNLAYQKEGTDIAKLLNAKGIAGIVLKYRLPLSKSNIVKDISPLIDAQRAIRLTRFYAKEWNILENNVGIMGFSAGGHLASTAATHFDTRNKSNDSIDALNSRPDFAILIYPVITFDEKYTHKGSKTSLIGENPDKKLIEKYSNELQVSKDTPPTFLVHAGDDKTVPIENSLLFYNALIKNGVEAEMHIYPEGGHGFALANEKRNLSGWPDLCIVWMRDLSRKKND